MLDDQNSSSHRWGGLTVIAVFLLFAVVNNLCADCGTGIPVDLARAFQAPAGQSFDTVRQGGRASLSTSGR
jgi:hypothetical protein